jgi:general secretion pathway protein D
MPWSFERGVLNVMPTFNWKAVSKGVSLAVLAMGLQACATVTGSQPAPARPVSTVSSGGGPAAVQAVQIPALQSDNSAEQQQLLAQINRSGQVVTIPGYREPVPAAVNPQGDDVVEFNYEQADLRLVLEELADAVDISILIDPTIDDRISIRTSEDRPLSRADIWPLVRLLTRDAGITLERVGNVYNARRATSPLPVEITTAGDSAPLSASQVMQVTPLVHVSATAAQELLGPLVPENAILRLSNTNVLAISGSPAELERINQLLLLIDADPFASQGIQLYPLSNANAAEVATELQEILTQIEGQNPAYQVRGIERINALLVTAPAARGFDEISRWIRILDADSQEQVEQLFHYRVKNLNAVELAETLTNVFEDRDEDNQPPPSVLANRNAIADPQQAELTTAQVNPDAAVFTAPGAVSANLRVRIVADEATNSLLIRSSARDYRQLLTTISQLDVVPLQVMVNAVIAQVTLSDDTRFGVDWTRVAANAQVSNISTQTGTSFLPQGGLDGLLFNKSFVDGNALVDATLEAIAVNNEVRLLARPSLTVSNNQEGEIQIGADVPVEQGETVSTGGLATTNIQYRPTGIELYITPQINDDGVVNLVIRQVLSSVDNSATGVNQNPVFNNQEISTTVVVRNGDSVVLGGLIQNDNELLNSGVPGLNRIPVLGSLFSYRQNNQERRELFIVLRPEIINLNNQSSLQYADILSRFELAAEMFEEAGIQ